MVIGTMPMRFNIIRYLIRNANGGTPKEIHDAIYPVYEGEGQCTELEIDEQLMSLKGVCLVEVVSTVEKDNGFLESIYKITSYGKARAKKHIGEYL